MNAQKVLVGIFYDLPLRTIVFAPVEGTYSIKCDNIYKTSIDYHYSVKIYPQGDSLVIVFHDGKKLLVNEIRITSENKYAYFRLGHNIKPTNFRQYDDGIILKNRFGNLLLINEVDMNDYLCGVIEKEAGKKKHPEYYKTQAVLCMTYWAKARPNHVLEGFELCDGVHCQAYMGKSSAVPAIINAVASTEGLIACDTSGMPVTAVFHSNCGGETEAAENVWSSSRPYLKPVKDPYCTSSPNASWTKSVSGDEWIKYLKANGFRTDSIKDLSEYGFVQENRTKYYKVKNDSIPFVKLRNELKLKSSFFSVTTGEGKITLYGRGYGHGVGMCQEGAMQMAKKGKDFEEILHFYFTGVELKSITETEVFYKQKEQLIINNNEN